MKFVNGLFDALAPHDASPLHEAIGFVVAMTIITVLFSAPVLVLMAILSSL